MSIKVLKKLLSLRKKRSKYMAKARFEKGEVKGGYADYKDHLKQTGEWSALRKYDGLKKKDIKKDYMERSAFRYKGHVDKARRANKKLVKIKRGQ